MWIKIQPAGRKEDGENTSCCTKCFILWVEGTSGVQNEFSIRQNRSGKVLKASSRFFFFTCAWFIREATNPPPSYHQFLQWFPSSWAAIGYRKDELAATSLVFEGQAQGRITDQRDVIPKKKTEYSNSCMFKCLTGIRSAQKSNQQTNN